MRSFMSGSKARLGLKMIVFMLLLAVMVQGLNFLVFPRNSWSRSMMNEFYEHKDLDVIFLGTSSTYRSNVPLLIDEEANVRSYNLATPAQSFMASYYLLKEAVKYNNVDLVVLHVNISRFQTNMINHSYQHQAFENLDWSFDKLEFLIRGFTVSHYPDALFKCFRARENMRPAAIKRNLTYKKVIDPADYPEEVFPYLGKGYSFNGGMQTPGELIVGIYSVYNPNKFRPENVEYFNRIVALCKEKKIDLILMPRPRLAANILAGNNYGEFHEHMQRLADENGISLWDLTYLRPEVLKIEDTMFSDGYHANYTLSLPLSRLIGKMIKEHKAGTLDIGEYLFDTYEQYLETNHRIAGIYTSKLSSEKVIKAYAAAGKDIEPEFRFLLSTSEQGEYTQIRDWNVDDKVDLSEEKKGKYWLMIEARQVGSDGEVEQRIRTQVDLR